MQSEERITENSSPYHHLEQMQVEELLRHMNEEDQKVAVAVQQALPQVERLVHAVVNKMKDGGRLFYIGTGTSGRLGIVDASECPPTFGVPPDWVVGLMAGGDQAIRKAVEFAEDDRGQGWKDLQERGVSSADLVIGISASGTTPYVLGALEACRVAGIPTGCVVCNPGSPIASAVDFPVAVTTGPEFLTGSTRMKAGTAQKMVLNMVSTAAMIQLGRVLDNKMVDMQLSNEKLIERGARMLMREYAWDYKRARGILLEYGSVRKVLDTHKKLKKKTG